MMEQRDQVVCKIKGGSCRTGMKLKVISVNNYRLLNTSHAGNRVSGI